MDIISKEFRSKPTSVDREKRTFWAVITTTAIDRHGEIVLSSGCQSEHYERNPVLLVGHDHGEDLGTLAGKCLQLRKAADKIEALFQVAGGDLGDRILDLLEEGVLSTLSIGFYSLKRLSRWSSDAEKATLPPFARQALESGECTGVHASWELLEVSLVKLPSNRECVVKTALVTGDAASDAEALIRDLAAELAPWLLRLDQDCREAGLGRSDAVDLVAAAAARALEDGARHQDRRRAAAAVLLLSLLTSEPPAPPRHNARKRAAAAALLLAFNL